MESRTCRTCRKIFSPEDNIPIVGAYSKYSYECPSCNGIRKRNTKTGDAFKLSCSIIGAIFGIILVIIFVVGFFSSCGKLEGWEWWNLFLAN